MKYPNVFICEAGSNDSLRILKEVTLDVVLDESLMDLITRYKGNFYILQGGVRVQYINMDEPITTLPKGYSLAAVEAAYDKKYTNHTQA